MEHLSRLASKPGVQATLILSKTDGAIICSTGLTTSMSTSRSDTLQMGDSTSGTDGSRTALFHEQAGYGSQGNDEKHSAEEVAKMAFSLVSAAAVLTNGLEEGDEAQLLRMRTRKYEVVIVPGEHAILELVPKSEEGADLTWSIDSKFLLVVIHDAPKPL